MILVSVPVSTGRKCYNEPWGRVRASVSEKNDKKTGRGERACPLQVHRKSPDLQDGFAEMV